MLQSCYQFIGNQVSCNWGLNLYRCIWPSHRKMWLSIDSVSLKVVINTIWYNTHKVPPKSFELSVTKDAPIQTMTKTSANSGPPAASPDIKLCEPWSILQYQKVNLIVCLSPANHILLSVHNTNRSVHTIYANASMFKYIILYIHSQEYTQHQWSP